ncbi:MAG: DUF362 domain-containing protein [Spirochaetes bacterium]|nr:DUF362 domain-containing protein [Spirochaetota bacterium]
MSILHKKTSIPAKQTAVVALVRCETYDYPDVKRAVDKGLALLGGMQTFVKPGERIVLKPNLLAADDPARAVTTHPSVVRAVAEAVRDVTGVQVSAGDSPGFGSTDAVIGRTGIAAAMREADIAGADFSTAVDVAFEGIQARRLSIARGVTEHDGLISLPKMKTHGFQRFSGAVKNQFGCLPGLIKSELHVKIPGALEFAEFILDLNACVNPRLYIMDGIVAMEGNGPRGGNPKPMHALLFSNDPIAIDSIACMLICLDPEVVPTNSLGAKHGFGVSAIASIAVRGERLDDMRDRSFKVEHRPLHPFLSNGVTGTLTRLAVPKPYIRSRGCTKCGTCVAMCPTKPKALSWPAGVKRGIPRYDYEKCIRCYCCQEICPEHTIYLTRPILRWFVDLVDRIFFR